MVKERIKEGWKLGRRGELVGRTGGVGGWWE